MTISKTLTMLFATSAALSFTAQGHDGHHTHISWAACEDKALAQQCSFTRDEQVHQGTCQAVKHLLVCDKNQPPVLTATNDAAPIHLAKIPLSPSILD